MHALPESVAVYALTKAGAGQAMRIAAGLPRAELWVPERLAGDQAGVFAFSRLTLALKENFTRYQGHVVVAASGITVRAIAPLLNNKTVDPAVVVVDQEGRFAISLVSGHLGRANDLARAVAEVLGGQAVITTATDSAGLPSLEVLAREAGFSVDHIKALSRLSRAVLEGEPVPVYDPDGWFKPILAPWPEAFTFLNQPPGIDDETPLVWVGPEERGFPESWLLIRPPCLVVGLGCNRGASEEEMLGLVTDVFSRHNWSLHSIARLASIEAKRDETGLLSLAGRLGLKIDFFSPEELDNVTVPNPSPAVERHMGVKSVCEAAALLASGQRRLAVAKQKSVNVTVAVARTDSG